MLTTISRPLDGVKNSNALPLDRQSLSQAQELKTGTGESIMVFHQSRTKVNAEAAGPSPQLDALKLTL